MLILDLKNTGTKIAVAVSPRNICMETRQGSPKFHV